MAGKSNKIIIHRPSVFTDSEDENEVMIPFVFIDPQYEPLERIPSVFIDSEDEDEVTIPSVFIDPQYEPLERIPSVFIRDVTQFQPWKGQESSSYQRTWKNNTMDKETGTYTRATVKESHSTGDVFKERSSGRTGYKDEFKMTSIAKFGDKSGYYEYQREERFRRVNFEDNSSSNKGRNSRGTNKNYLE